MTQISGNAKELKIFQALTYIASEKLLQSTRSLTVVSVLFLMQCLMFVFTLSSIFLDALPFFGNVDNLAKVALKSTRSRHANGDRQSAKFSSKSGRRPSGDFIVLVDEEAIQQHESVAIKLFQAKKTSSLLSDCSHNQLEMSNRRRQNLRYRPDPVMQMEIVNLQNLVQNLDEDLQLMRKQYSNMSQL
ncbi:hypothetical protein AC249_AIPGENE23062 [Exaiptasia diaphana]|nr:hypothetical protein AC249_AIPGENE23062 [Exaiptasia diaphana]